MFVARNYLSHKSILNMLTDHYNWVLSGKETLIEHLTSRISSQDATVAGVKRLKASNNEDNDG